MRITERNRIGTLNLVQSRAAERLDKAARVASSGERVTKPSDDPAAFGSMVRRDYSLVLLEERSKNATRAKNELSVVESTLTAGIDLLVKAKESAVTGANATTDASSRKLLAEDVRTMKNELLSIANTRFADRYLFGGSRTDQPPFDVATGAFLGNDQIIRVPVMDGVAPPSNISGGKTFTSLGGRDIFADLDALANALDTNNEAGIRAMLDPLTLAHDQLVKSQVEAGFSAKRFENAIDVITATTAATTERLSNEIEGDPGQQISDLTLAKTAYERSIAVTKQILALSAQ